MFNFNNDGGEIIVVIDVACLSKQCSLEDTLNYLKETGILIIDTSNGGKPPYSITRTKTKYKV